MAGPDDTLKANPHAGMDGLRNTPLYIDFLYPRAHGEPGLIDVAATVS